MAYGLFKPDPRAYFGGSEVRLWMLAKELARRGRFDVRFVVADWGQPPVEVRDGVALHAWVGREIWGVPSRRPAPPPPPAKRPSYWFRAVRWFRRYPLAMAADYLQRLHPLHGHVEGMCVRPEMIQVYDEIDADVYLIPGNSELSAEAAFYCSRRGRKFVFVAGSDMDCYVHYKDDPTGRDIYGTSYALKVYSILKADAHIVQNPTQAELLRAGYQRSPTIVENPIDLATPFARPDRPRTVLWIGKSDERVKRPSVMLELARRFPEYEFVAVLGLWSTEAHAQVVATARSLPNVRVLEYVPFDEVERYYAEARVLLNTSAFEGFPNAFLQAAKYKVPILSLTVDPAGMLSRHRCGLVADGDVDRLATSLKQLMTDDALCADLGARARAYVELHHAKEGAAEKVERVLDAVLGRRTTA